MWRRKLSLKWSLLLLAGAFLFGICSRGIGSIKARSHIAAVFADALKQPLPSGFTSINADRFYSYGIYSGNYSVERLDGNVEAASNLLGTLKQDNIAVFESRPKYDREASKRASWWHPESYANGKFFTLEGNCDGHHAVLSGYLFPESNGCSLFLKMREP